MSKRIIISVSSDLTTDQRVQKVAKTLYSNGYEILLVGRLKRNSDNFSSLYPHKRLKLFFEKSFFFYAELNIRLFFFLFFYKSDYLLANDTDTLLSNFLVSKLKGKKLIFDAHELFPEVPEIVHRKIVKKMWTAVENLIFPRLKNAYTVSASIAEYYKNKYGITMQVIPNYPATKKIFPRSKFNFGDKKIIFYQGVLNVGRGLEWVIDAMPLVNDQAIFVIAGDGDITYMLQKKIKEMNLQQKVIFVGKITPDELSQLTPLANIGICLLENDGLSYYFSLPNKLFDYIQAGVPVLASDFPEISNVINSYHVGKTISEYTPAYLSLVLNNMLDESQNEEYRNRIREVAGNFRWERVEQKLLSIFENSK